MSVTGFGLGTGSFSIAFGGFFLFFTNFVAIIIATCTVFYFYGFKPSMITEADVAYKKKHVMLLAVVLFVISIPLIYTLHKSISGILADLFKKEYGDVVTVAIGDSPNDIPMLERVDRPIIVRKHDGTYDERIRVPDLLKANGIGPDGWNRAVLNLFRSNLLS